MSRQLFKASLLRRFAQIALSLGICHNLLEKQELLGFEFRPNHFERLDFKFDLQFNGQFDDILSQAAAIVKRYTYNFYLNQNEATLRSFLWDQVLSVLITEVVIVQRTVVSEFCATKLLIAKIVVMAILTNHVDSPKTSTPIV